MSVWGAGDDFCTVDHMFALVGTEVRKFHEALSKDAIKPTHHLHANRWQLSLGRASWRVSDLVMV